MTKFKFLKKSFVVSWIIAFLFIQIFKFPIFKLTKPIYASSDLILNIESDDNFIVMNQKYANLSLTANYASFLTVKALVDKDLFLIEKNISLAQNITKEISIPICYPLDKNFRLIFSLETIDGLKSTISTKDFIVKKIVKGSYSISGRVVQCSKTEKIGIEGAKIEIKDGPTYSSSKSCDDGYFSLDNLLRGTYKIAVSHKCSSALIEKIVVVGEKTAFLEFCLSTYGIPDIDLWLNKPDGSSYELGERATIFMRSSFELNVDLYLEDEVGLVKPILINNTLKEGVIHSFYWEVPKDESLGKKFLRLVPKEKNLCGEARYAIEIVSDIRYGVIRGKVTCNDLPVKNALVYLPLQFTDQVKTDAFGSYEIKGIPSGIHVVRCSSDGFNTVDIRGVEVRRGNITSNVNFSLTSEKVSFNIYPGTIKISNFEHREKDFEIELSLDGGFLKDAKIQKLEGPEGINIVQAEVPFLLGETRILTLHISDKCIPDEYDVKFRIGNDSDSTDLSGKIIIAGLSSGTFDGKVIPNKITLPQNEEAQYILLAEKYSNFSYPLELNILNLPPYSEISDKNSLVPPAQISFNLKTSLSTPPGLYSLILEVKGGNQVIYFPFQLEVLKAGGELVSIPENGWHPIIIPGKEEIIPIHLFADKGVTQNVRVNIDYGPQWLNITERNIGEVSYNGKFTFIKFAPPKDLFPGGYDYSISFTYGQRNEGFLKFSGRVTLTYLELDAPTNLRAKYIKEDNKVILTWGPPAEKAEESIAGYNVYKSSYYPSFENRIPINNTLIKDRYFEDTDFRLNRNYWYLVKAVYSDGTLSSDSNTASITIPPLVEANLKMSIKKGEGATYFTGESLSVEFSANTQGTLEVRLVQDRIQALILTNEIISNLKYIFNIPIPGIYGKVKVQAKLTNNLGVNAIQEQEIIIKESVVGNSTVKGILWNSYYDSPIAFSEILIYSGESIGRAISNVDGSFEFSDLKDGSYVFVLVDGSFKILLDPIDVRGDLDLEKIELALKKDSNLIAWMPKDYTTVVKGDEIRLNLYSAVDTLIAVRIGNHTTFRDLISFKEIISKRTYSEGFIVPYDLPNGFNYVVLEDLLSGQRRIFPVKIKGGEEELYGVVLDSFGNPIKDATVIAFLGEDSNVKKTNEFGYFNFTGSYSKIIVKKDSYSEKELSTEGIREIEVKLPFSKGEIECLSNVITSSSDANEVETKFLSKGGAIEDLSLKVKSSGENAIFEKHALDLFPGYIYEFALEGLDLGDGAKLEFTNSNIFKEIDIKSGFKYKIFADIFPESIILKHGEEIEVSLDLYSFGTYKKSFSLGFSSSLNELKVSFEPERLVLGNLCKVYITLPSEAEEGYYLFNFIIKDDEENESIIPYYLYIIPNVTPKLISNVWMPMIYLGVSDSQRFYFSEKVTSISIGDALSGLSYKFEEDYIQISININKEGIIENKFSFVVQENVELEIYLKVQVVEKKEIVPLKINAKSSQDGVEIEISNITPYYSYFVNRTKSIEGINFLNMFPVSDNLYIDKTAQERNIYYYSLFYTDGLLGIGWSNTQKITYRKFFLNINIKDELLTNNEKLVVSGSVPIDTKLTINDRIIPLSQNGAFNVTIYLKEGENKLIFKVWDDFGNILLKEIKVILDTNPPPLEILNFVENYFETVSESLLIRLKSEPGVLVDVNGVRVSIDKHGFSEYLLKLNIGRNEFLITATDLAGNQTKKNITIIRFKKIIIMELKVGSNTAIVNDKSLTLDVPPQIINGRTLVPIRFISEAFGAEVIWEPNTKSIKISFDGHYIILNVGSNKAIVNDKSLTLDVPPQIINGRTLVPIRFISEAFGAEVIWEPNTKSIKISYKA